MSEEDKKDVTIGEQFKDLPMKDLIGGPLAAAAKEQIEIAQKTCDFIERMSEEQPQTALLFAGAKGEISGNTEVEVPLLAVVPIPSVEGNPTFEMEVVSDEEGIETGDNEAEEGTDKSVRSGFLGFKVSVSGNVESPPSKEKETEAKHQVHVSASEQPQKEDLSKVTELMSETLKKEK